MQPPVAGTWSGRGAGPEEVMWAELPGHLHMDYPCGV